MSFCISPNIFENFPGLMIGVLIVKDLDNTGNDPEIAQMLADAQERVRTSVDPETITEHPRIAPWREAYRKFGSKPSAYRSSIENLVRRTLKGNTIPRINPLVDLYNVISLQYLLPAGGEDLGAVKGNIVLTYATENEAPVKCLGEETEETPYGGEVIYRDDIGAICRRWNWREADRTKLTEDTKNAILVIEALPSFAKASEGEPPVTKEELEKVLDELSELVKRFCGGEVEREVRG